MALTSLLVPTYRQMLGSLSAWLDKAQAQRQAPDADALLSARLAPDMFPLATQIRFACVQAWEGAYRLRGRDFPPIVQAMLDEGRAAGERPGTMAAAQGRIADTLAMLDGLAADALDMDTDAPIAHDLPNGMIFDLTAQGYARDWTLPQFYFHIMTAYALLRSTGVPLGKGDYVAHLLPSLRAGTMPGH
ncbi:DUF1993 domain-containing protein [Sphingobium sp. HBC34]|uniref:DUF1993 domain-containing protein n=1 Tax=Sphingobium cyanobacteriorum TaxID=3063954 RepID=A0ABT8ZNV8_9SPHN|nr:DUF1993 domain-containing protein [Sphingobium sp. HBC34]MDO7835882.1 DUF1993 domain-containing protein [Sphingobium sp. HBC34]